MKTEFEWSRIGDIAAGRENLGPNMLVAVYRLFQYTMMDVLVDCYGSEEANALFRAAGRRAGKAFYKYAMNKPDDVHALVSELQEKLATYKIGIFRMEKMDLSTLSFQLTVSEDLDCSGLPVTGEVVCSYDEGFIGAILEEFTGVVFDVKEIDCWATGDRTCRFTASPIL